MKSFKPRDRSDEPPPQDGRRNREADFRGQKRSNATHASTTDPQAPLYRKGPGKEAKLGFIGHALMENRNGLVADACLTEANGHAERIAALHMIEPRADRPRPIALGADKAYDAEFRRRLHISQFSDRRPLAGSSNPPLLPARDRPRRSQAANQFREMAPRNGLRRRRAKWFKLRLSIGKRRHLHPSPAPQATAAAATGWGTLRQVGATRCGGRSPHRFLATTGEGLLG
jgi:hypothetical protein